MTSAGATRLLIVGGSTRAAAWSAYRAGLRPVCADLFADRDLAQVAEVVPLAHYPQSLVRDVADVSVSGWMFVGAMENHREALTRLADRLGPCCGPSPDVIARLRDPAWLARRLGPQGCYPEVVLPPGMPPAFLEGRPVRWLSKPMSGGGGRGVRLASDAATERRDDEPRFWQRYVEGIPASAVWLSTGKACRLLFVSEQLIGWQEAAATPFTYCGSLGPWPLSSDQRGQLGSIQDALLDGLDYRGLLGVDLVWDGRQFWVIEVNPRYTASCELWDLTTGRSAVGEHLLACRFDVPSPALGAPPATGRARSLKGAIVGKLVLFADEELIAPDLSRCLAPRDPWSLPFVADVPAAGSQISAGGPVCTIFASGPSREECRRKLLRRMRRVRGWFRSSSSTSSVSSQFAETDGR